MEYWNIRLMPGTQPDLVATYHSALLPQRNESINVDQPAPTPHPVPWPPRNLAIGLMRRAGWASITAVVDHYQSRPTTRAHCSILQAENASALAL